MFEAYITNTALYPMMGIEVGTTVHFPTITQEVQAALAKIGIDGKRYSEVFITSFDSDVLGLYDYLDEYENIDELNELGHALLEVRDKGGLETFEAALVLGKHTGSVKDLINLTQNLDLYRFYPDISDDEGLGHLYADELGTIDIPEHIQGYFDYEASATFYTAIRVWTRWAGMKKRSVATLWSAASRASASGQTGCRTLTSPKPSWLPPLTGTARRPRPRSLPRMIPATALP
jgi:hypothetical protein